MNRYQSWDSLLCDAVNDKQSLTLMFALLILPQKRPHLRVYEQTLTDKSEQRGPPRGLPRPLP